MFLEVESPSGVCAEGSTGIQERKLLFAPSSTMTSATGHAIFVNSTSANFYGNVPRRRASHAGNMERRRETAGGGYHHLSECSESTGLHTVKRVLEVLNDGRMEVAGFLDALCWGNRLAVTDQVAKSARTNRMHSDRLATVFSRWLRPPRTSQGGSTAAGGARQILLPVVIEPVKVIINREMNAIVEELKEGSANVTEEGILETAIEEVQGMRLQCRCFMTSWGRRHGARSGRGEILSEILQR